MSYLVLAEPQLPPLLLPDVFCCCDPTHLSGSSGAAASDVDESSGLGLGAIVEPEENIGIYLK